MNEIPTDTAPDRYAIKLTSDSHFSWLRTRLSVERTLMAWVRTAIALIGFGFTIAQFLTRLQNTPGAPPVLSPSAPRNVGLVMIAAGVIAMIIAARQYLMVSRYLWSENFSPLAGIHTGRQVHTPVLAISIGVIVIGLFAFASVVYRMM